MRIFRFRSSLVSVAICLAVTMPLRFSNSAERTPILLISGVMGASDVKIPTNQLTETEFSGAKLTTITSQLTETPAGILKSADPILDVQPVATSTATVTVEISTDQTDGDGQKGELKSDLTRDSKPTEVKVEISEVESQSTPSTTQSTVDSSQPTSDLDEVIGVKSEKEAMLSFEEWRKKIAETDHSKQQGPEASNLQPNLSGGPSASSTAGATGNSKKVASRARNYASSECGAKVVAANTEAQATLRMLNEQMDEYMLNPCGAKIWFVIELCESVQPAHVELANFELFSSTPKEFVVWGSATYPTREWQPLGNFSAANIRQLQNFDVSQQGFSKYIKIEMNSHYGSEHFCPISVVRVFGISLFEEVEQMDSNHDERQFNLIDDDRSEGDAAELNPSAGPLTPTGNIFTNARDVVINVVRKVGSAFNAPAEQKEVNKTQSVVDQLVLQRRAVQLFPVIQNYLWQCLATENLSKTARGGHFLNYAVNCAYISALLGQELFDLLNKSCFGTTDMLFFQCPANHTRSKEASGDEKTNEQALDEKLSEKKSSDEANAPLHDAGGGTERLSDGTNRVSRGDNSADKNAVEEGVDGGGGKEESAAEATTTAPVEDTTAAAVESDSSEQIRFDSKLTPIVDETVKTEPKSSESVEQESLPTPSQQPTQSSQESSQAGQGQPPVVPQNGNGLNNILANVGSGQAKESILVRLSNRVKALEVNLSLSSQYLEELSQRYRRQMEEMQRAFNRTISKLNTTANLANQRDLKQQEAIVSLESKLSDLNEKLQVLLMERENLNWQFIEIHIALMAIELIIVVILLLACSRRLSNRVTQVSQHLSKQSQSRCLATPVKRFSMSFESNGDCSPHKTPKLDYEECVPDFETLTFSTINGHS